MPSSPENPFAPPRANVDDLADGGGNRPQLANPVARLMAFVVDLALPVIVTATALAQIPGNLHRGVSANTLSWTFPLVAACVLISYYFACGLLIHRRGQTVGKLALGIRIVRSDGRRASFPRILFMRWMPTFVVGVIPFIGTLIVLVDSLMIFRRSRQCLHDQIADTIVVTAASSMAATRAFERRDSHG